MLLKQSALLTVALAVLLQTSGVRAPQAIAAGIEKLTPARIKQIQRSNKSFKDCQKQAIQAHKGSPGNQLRVAMDSCRERFPGAGLYVDCKRRILKTTPAPLRSEALGECRKYLTAAAFDPDASVPFFLDGSQVYFAGIGLNRPTPVGGIDLPNYECARLRDTAKDPQQAQHLLFGNQPNLFEGLRGLAPRLIAAALQVPDDTPEPSREATKGRKKSDQGKKTRKKNEAKEEKQPGRDSEGRDTAGFGRLYGDVATGLTYFPVAPCDFDAQTGVVYSGLSAWYLMDFPAQTATPYFGIAYYRPDATVPARPRPIDDEDDAEDDTTTSTTGPRKGQTAKTEARIPLRTEDLVEQIKAMLGPETKAIRKNRQVQFFTAEPLRGFDHEGDPKNLCAQPRSHRVIAVLQTLKGRPEVPEYLLLANIRNLCDYGDRLAQRLIR